MTRVAWPALMRLGMIELGLAPAVFWDLTPAELMLLAGEDGAPRAITRAAFEELAARFPNGSTISRVKTGRRTRRPAGFIYFSAWAPRSSTILR